MHGHLYELGVVICLELQALLFLDLVLNHAYQGMEEAGERTMIGRTSPSQFHGPPLTTRSSLYIDLLLPPSPLLINELGPFHLACPLFILPAPTSAFFLFPSFVLRLSSSHSSVSCLI